MWKSIKISQQAHFIYCNINDKDEITLVLYNLKEAWHQTVDLKDVKLKVKLLNKRFDFNEDNIREAFTSGQLKFAVIEEQPHTSVIKQETILLKVKYGIKNCELNYEWSLKRQSFLEFQTEFVQPLLLALSSCLQQVDILTECIRKKDAELHQYRIEGAVLGRITLATKPFDFESFNKKYEEGNKIAVDFKELAQYVLEAKHSSDGQTTNEHIKLQPAKKEEEKPNNVQSDREKLTPKKRKRKRDFEILCLERHLEARKKGLQYESSQSQTTCSESSQLQEEITNDVVDAKPALNASRNTKNNDNETAKSPRKSARLSPFKRKPEHEPVINLDSDNESLKSTKLLKISGVDGDQNKEKQNNSANQRSFRERKLNNSPKNSTENSQTKSLKIFEFSTDTEGCSNSLHDDQTNSSSSIKSKNLIYSPLPPIVDDLSLQLNNIKKELECLEAMRLADLKKRSCKAK